MEKRELYIKIWRELSENKSMVFLAGPRQAGKTTLAELISADFSNALYFNWDITEHRKKLLADPNFFTEVERKDAGLAALVAYPLKRKNPLPDIANQKEFTTYYPVIFDEAFRKKLRSYSDAYVFARNYSYGLVGGPFNGDLWLNEEGKISAINYLSAEELKLKNQITAKIRRQVHPSIREWKQNILVGRSKNLIIRIDRTEKGLRYVSWSKGRSMAAKPDLILYNGVEEPQGTMGGWTWTFINQEWTYIVDDVEMCETPDQCGLFLRLLFNNVEKSTIKLDAIK